LSKFKTFGELQTARRNYIVSARENDFEDGLRTLLAELYPDNAHFIYELLQNAEDARATEVRFNLFKDRLEVAHNGKREFTLGDVEAITGIGQSMKKDDPTQIGKFGVGFKAVFTYTNHPEVHSGNFSFVINDLFVPEETSPSHVKGETKFVFPFDRTEKDVATSYKEIARGLNEIGSSTLLFLSGVSMVKFEIEGGETGSVSRDDLETPRILIQETKGGEEKSSYWLRLLDNPEGFDEKITVAAAFSLHDSSGKGSTSNGVSKLRVQPVDAGDTCIYFPAVKETSGLRFHIHAPFASTVARDSVRDDPGNAELVAAIGALIVRELPVLRDQGLLDDGLLSALPNIDDVLVAPYDEIRRAIYAAFNDLELTPVFGGGAYARGSELFLSPTEFRSGLDPSDLEPLLALSDFGLTTNPRWISPRSGRAGQFLKGVNTRLFGWDALQEILENLERWGQEEIGSIEYRDAQAFLMIWRNWISAKSNARLRVFYELIGHGRLKGDIHVWPWYKIPIIRISIEGIFHHVDGKGIHLPFSREDIGPNRVPIELWFFDDESNATDQLLAAFYQGFRIKKWDDQAAVLERLAIYQKTSRPDEEEHLRDLDIFITYLDNHPSDLKIFQRINLLFGEDSQGNIHWVEPAKLVIDSPYELTGLSSLPGFKYRLWSGYKGRVKEIIKFAQLLKARSSLTFQEISPRGNRSFNREWTWQNRETDNGMKRDWGLPEFDSIVESMNTVLLCSLWELVCGENRSKAQAIYRANGTSTPHYFQSHIAQELMAREWVLDRYGALRTPKSMTEEDLPEGWSRPSLNSLALEVGFGEESRALEAVVQERRMQAESLGIPDELIEIWGDLGEDGQNEFLDLMRERKRISSFPGETSNDPMRRAAFSTVESLVAPLNEKVISERSVSNGEKEKVKEQAREFLRQKYTSESGLHCQACHEPASFKYENKWFFEAVEFVRKRDRLLKENYLALCPLCAAKYKYVREPKDNEVLMASVMEWSIDDESPVVELAIALAGKRVNLKFAQTHAISLKAALKAAGETRN
jgi:hypothetical protein